MKKISLFLISLIVFSCEKAKNSTIEDTNQLKVSNSTQTVINNSISVWEEYKRRPVNSIKDEAPYNGCYFEVKDKKFHYYKDSKLMYIDDFVYDSNLNRTMFKNHYMDEIIFNKDSTDVVLKRDNYEGEYEYFKRK